MTRKILDLLTPSWAVHFHADGQSGRSSACYDARCEIAPLATSAQPPFAPEPPSRPLSARRRGVPALRWPAVAGG